ncbi:hypothetical protein [Halopseudomonas laoshanensis]|uniref:hypothetical protein n=1 Tax=Halopseudomonas laoshanensis TaxID=2268758 RepID=UPI001FE985F6|nr:hypothetical protein [Halopseudomonas laoshanensis]
MRTEEISNNTARIVGNARAKGLYTGILLLAGMTTNHLAWADGAWETGALGKPVVWQQVVPTAIAPAPVPIRKVANFKGENVSEAARQVVNWVVDSGDNAGLPFLIVDKVQARVLMFDAQGQLTGSASALLGMAVGDDTVPGIGQRRLSSILPNERTTPAGRFEASVGRNLAGKEILWVDYDAAISLHRVVTSNAKERRAERLASPLIEDNRISYGCINVPVAFFDEVVLPAFAGTNGIVYTLPETRENQSVFSSYYELE